MNLTIAGGGLAGLLTAYFAKNNYKNINIELFEKFKLEKYRIDCAEGLANQRDSFKIIGKLVKPFVTNRLNKLVWMFDVDGEIKISSIKNRNFCIMIDRLKFQLFLIKKLQEMGVKINFGEKVNLNELEGDVVVDARGSKPGNYCQIAIYKILEGNFENVKDTNFWMVKKDEPETLYWLFPLGNKIANLGCSGKVSKVRLNNFIKFISDFLSLEMGRCIKNGAGLLDYSYAAMMLEGKEKEVFFKDKNVIVKVGDAAGLVDPFYGEGMSGAILSAFLLSKNLKNLENYKNLLKKKNEFLKDRMVATLERISNFDFFLNFMLLLDGIDMKYTKFKPVFVFRYPRKFLKMIKT